jgi:uncharacterized SAM-binding protein YcdF (DUF218 family)
MGRTEIPLARPVLDDAQILWDYHRLAMPFDSADVILGLGSYDLSVAGFAASLFLDGRGQWLFFAGGLVPRNDLLQTPWNLPEADVFGQHALDMGVPGDRIIIERKSLNTGENFRFFFEELRGLKIRCNSVIVVTKPNMERRARATALLNLPESINVTVTSPPSTFESYSLSFDASKIINLMVGDLQRIDIYPALGFQKAEFVPDKVRRAYERLIRADFTKHLLQLPAK